MMPRAFSNVFELSRFIQNSPAQSVIMITLKAKFTDFLQEHLNQQQPVVIVVDSLKEERRIFLPIARSEQLRVVSISRIKNEMRPYFCRRLRNVPNSFFLIAEELDTYRVLFCLSHRGISSSIQGDEEGLWLVLKGNVAEHLPVLVCVDGSNLYQTIEQAVRLGMKQVSSSGRLTEEKPPIHRWMETLGWESGGAFGNSPTHDKIISAVWGLRQAGFQPGYVIIDEGWQQIVTLEPEQKKMEVLCGFEADRECFPMGLSALVHELQRAGVHHVGVSHALQGCRGGVSAELAEFYGLGKESQLGADLGKTFQFYHDYYRYLKEQGISFVKVKHQSDVGRENKASIKNRYYHLQSAIQAASSLHFDAPHLNSDCICSDNLFYWTTSRLASVADETETESELGAKRVIRNSLVISLWMKYLMNPDFNSWSTDLPQSGLLAILHALSGTTNVVSDPPGKYNVELLRKCVLPSGRLLKCDFPLTLCRGSIFVNPLQEPMLYKGFSCKGDWGIVALFHLSRRKKPIQGVVCASDVEEMTGERFAVYSHRQGYLGVHGKNQGIPITVKSCEADVVTFSPIEQGVAVIGCYSYYLAPGPIQEVTLEEDSMHITSLVTTPIMIYSERQVMEVRRNGSVIPWDYDEFKQLLVIDSRQTQREISTVYTITFE
jgi:hypothetical protein